MTVPNTPLAVLDLVPVPAGCSAAEALRNSIDLTRQTERFGYTRYWFAEHHLNAGTAGTSPAVLLALAASTTSTMRIGSGAVLMGHRTALTTVEEFGLLDALHPGRIDLGLGNTSGRGGPPSSAPRNPPPSNLPAAQTEPAAPNPPVTQNPPATDEDRIVRGLRIPSPASLRQFVAKVATAPLLVLGRELLFAPEAIAPDYGEQVGDILDMLAGRFHRGGITPPIVPGAGARPQVWIMGTTGGRSAQVAGANGLRFAVSYHVIPATVLEAVDAYRVAFRPSAELTEPYLAVSADVVVAPDEARARWLASGYGPWVHSARNGQGVIPFPTPEQAQSFGWTDQARELVADRVSTQFVGTPVQVADQLETLRDVTGADELVITTVTHDHADRVRSYQLLAEEWHRRTTRS